MHALEPSRTHFRTLAGRYRILHEIARGGMGVVYEGIDLREDRQVAIKMLSARADGDLLAVLRFRHEARTASTLTHPAICRIHGVGDYRQRPFIVMELLEGETVKQRITRTPPQPPEILDVAVQVTEGLEAAHAKSIIHRDVKPANVFITHDGAVKILDFGLAKTLTWDRTQATTLTLTGPQQTPGTVAYMAPEQLLGRYPDQRADLYSLGVMLYEMLCGYRPFRGNSTIETIANILNGTPPAPLPRMPLRGEWRQVIARMLAKEPRERYDSASCLLKDLRALGRMINGERASLSSRESASVRSQRVLALLEFRIDETEPHAGTPTGRHPRHLAQSIVRDLTAALSSIADVKLVPGAPVKATYRHREGLSHLARRLHANRLITGVVKTIRGELAVDIAMYDADERLWRWTRRYRRGGDDPVRLGERIVSDVITELHLDSDDSSTHSSDVTRVAHQPKLTALPRLGLQLPASAGAFARPGPSDGQGPDLVSAYLRDSAKRPWRAYRLTRVQIGYDVTLMANLHCFPSQRLAG
jgi:serine/threonine protein kinase